MNPFSTFLNNMDWWGLLEFLINILAVLVCLTFHELSHGLVAYKLGDTTAKNAGRLTLNPIKHIDIFGFLMMLVAHVGWAKAVPVNPSKFKDPKRDMAITALAGPVSNFLMALLFGGIFSVIFSYRGFFNWMLGSVLGWAVIQFLVDLVALNVGLGVFNLLPIPPLDGSKVLFSLLPEQLYWKILRYERYVMYALIALLWMGVFDVPLNWLIDQGLHLVGVVTRCPFWG